ncbi:hypothetical protein FB382_004400, partial [Nocardioides ginsengisegetis]
MAIATYADVAVELGRPIADPNEQAQVTWWLNGAELQIKARLGDVTLLDQEILKYVEVMAVAAKALNPTGAQYEAIDDYRYGLPAESRRVTILDEWWSMLDPDVGAAVFSVRATFTPDTP